MVLWIAIYSLQFAIAHRFRQIETWAIWASVSFSLVVLVMLASQKGIQLNFDVGQFSFDAGRLAAIAFGGGALGSISKLGIIGLKKAAAPNWSMNVVPILLFFALFLSGTSKLPVLNLLLLFAGVPLIISLNLPGWKTWGVWSFLTLVFAGYLYITPKHGGSAEDVAIIAAQLAIISSVAGLAIKVYLIKSKPTWAWRVIGITSFSVMFAAFLVPRLANEITQFTQAQHQTLPASVLADLR